MAGNENRRFLMKKKFNFCDAVEGMFERIGAQQGGRYGWQLDTIAGVLDIKPYDEWVACYFDDLEAAKEKIRFGCLGQYSGKWNWHFVKPTANDVEFLCDQFKAIAVRGSCWSGLAL
jgi:hypothetical protein